MRGLRAANFDPDLSPVFPLLKSVVGPGVLRLQDDAETTVHNPWGLGQLAPAALPSLQPVGDRLHAATRAPCGTGKGSATLPPGFLPGWDVNEEG